MDSQAQFVEEQLETLTGKRHQIRKDYWILNEKAFKKFFESQPEVLPLDEVPLLGSPGEGMAFGAHCPIRAK